MRYKLLFILFVFSLLASVAMAIDKESKFCPIEEIEEKGGCVTIQNSEYSEFFGIKNYYYGIIIFLFLSYLTYSFIIEPKKFKRQFIHIGIYFGSLIAVYFLYLQKFVLDDYCLYCLVVDISMLLALGLVLLERRKIKKWRKR